MTRADEPPHATPGRFAGWAAGLRPRTILIAGWLVFLLYAYPGYMSSDSIDQLLDARVGTFNDWHSPVMTELWRWTGFAIAGPFGMLALQSVLLLVAAYALLARTLSPRSAALLACGLLVYPPVMATMAVIWRDSQMAGFLLAGLALVTSRRRWLPLCGLGLLVLASAMRPSAALAVLPLIVLGWGWSGDRAAIAGWRRYALAAAAWAVVWLGAIGLDAALRSAATDHARLELATVDVLGTLRYAEPIDDAHVRGLLAGVPLQGGDLQARARTHDRRPAGATTGPDRLFDPPTDAAARSAIFAARTRLASAYPTAYLEHRWHVLYRVLGFGHRSDAVYTSFAGSSSQADAAVHMARHSAVQRVAIAAVGAFAQTPLFWPYLYAIAAIVLLPIALRRRHALAATLLASGLCYELSLGIVAASTSYALSHWMITATCLAGALMAIDRVRARRARLAVAAG